MHQDRAQPGNHLRVCQGTTYLERALGAQTQVLGLWKRPPSHTPPFKVMHWNSEVPWQACLVNEPVCES